MSDLTYIPAPQDSAAFNRRLAKLSGFAPNGLQRLKVVWGMDEKEFRDGQNDQIKYPSFDKTEVGMPFWIVEQWYPPTMFNEATWESDRFEDGVDLLGEFPGNGFYGMLFPVINDEHQYAPLGEKLYQQLVINVKARDNKELDQNLIIQQQKRKVEMQKQARTERLLFRNEHFDRYFSRDDYDNNRAYSLPSIIKPVTQEKRTAAGIILPN